MPVPVHQVEAKSAPVKPKPNTPAAKAAQPNKSAKPAKPEAANKKVDDDVAALGEGMLFQYIDESGKVHTITTAEVHKDIESLKADPSLHNYVAMVHGMNLVILMALKDNKNVDWDLVNKMMVPWIVNTQNKFAIDTIKEKYIERVTAEEIHEEWNKLKEDKAYAKLFIKAQIYATMVDPADENKIKSMATADYEQKKKTITDMGVQSYTSLLDLYKQVPQAYAKMHKDPIKKGDWHVIEIEEKKIAIFVAEMGTEATLNGNAYNSTRALIANRKAQDELLEYIRTICQAGKIKAANTDKKQTLHMCESFLKVLFSVQIK